MDSTGAMDEAASEALERWSDGLPAEVRVRAEAFCAQAAVTHLTVLAAGEWAALVKGSRSHEVTATWDGEKWAFEGVGGPPPEAAAAAAAVGLTLLAHDCRTRRAALLGVSARRLAGLEPVLTPAPALRVVVPFHVRLEVTSEGLDWFELRAVRDIADTTLTPLELKALIDAEGAWVDLGGKGWRRLENHTDATALEHLEQAGFHPHCPTNEVRRVHTLQLARDQLRHLLPAATRGRLETRTRELESQPAPEPPPALEAQLRPYQCEGFKFLCTLSQAGCGGILADDMGLGKTVQALAWLAHLREEAASAHRHVTGSCQVEAEAGQGRRQANTDLPSQSALVICPKSLMENWRTEAGKFLPGLRVRVWNARNLRLFTAEAQWAGLNIVSHPQLRQLATQLDRVRFLAAILDEAQAIKNPASAVAKAARSIRAEHRLALTGTPIENRLLDLWSIMAFAMPGALGDRVQFERQVGALEPLDASRSLAARVRPFLLRRTKDQVARDLPPKIEEDIVCEMGELQRTLYRAELKKAQQQLLVVEGERQFQEERFHVLASLMRLRQLCCDPALVFPGVHAPSAKLEAMDDLLDPILAEGHKVLIFSQFTTLLSTVRKRVECHQVPVFVLTGKTESRGAVVENFNVHHGPAIFLISLKAGGSGLNLATASYVVLLDPWWNPAAEAQAIDRAHRIGQLRTVIAYRLLMKNSLEEKIRALQAAKAALAQGVLGEVGFAKPPGLAELRELLAE